MKKIIVSDYDQTFYLNDEDIEKNKLSVNEFRNKGNLFVIATGRSFMDFKNKIKKYDIIYDYAIINHGATILDKEDNILYNFSIENNIIEDIKNDLELKNSTEGFCCSELESRVDFEHKDLTKINLRYNSKQLARDTNRIINEKYFKYVNSYHISSNSIEIISNKTNKSKAIQLLADKLNADAPNIYTIGDGYSDIQMVKDFNGYCMKESVEELKQIAIGECESVSELINKVMENI